MLRLFKASFLCFCWFLASCSVTTQDFPQVTEEPTLPLATNTPPSDNGVPTETSSPSAEATATAAPETVTTAAPTEATQNLQEIVAEQVVVLYTQPERDTYPLLSWPLLPLLGQDEFAAVYGAEIGYQYTRDFAPQLNAAGDHLLVPAVIAGDEVEAVGHSTTWLIDVSSGESEELAHQPPFAAWSPDGRQLVLQL